MRDKATLLRTKALDAKLPNDDANHFISGYTDPTNFLTPVGTFTQSSSYYGTFDQSGDIFQWNETAVVRGSSRGLRGGYWYNDASDSYLVSSYRRNGDPAAEYFEVGFRVASSEAVPEPGSIALLLAGGLCLLDYAWRRRRHSLPTLGTQAFPATGLANGDAASLCCFGSTAFG